MTPLVFATVGTSEHPFNRLVTWLDNWNAAHEGTRMIVQHGTARAPRHATGFDMITHDYMRECVSRALVVVTHGGPGSIMDARARGHVPIVVPRSGSLGEHVDDHQLLFTRALAGTGWIHLAESESALHSLLDDAARDIRAYRQDEQAGQEIPAEAPMNTMLTELGHRRPGLLSLRRARHTVNFLRGRGVS